MNFFSSFIFYILFYFIFQELKSVTQNATEKTNSEKERIQMTSTKKEQKNKRTKLKANFNSDE